MGCNISQIACGRKHTLAFVCATGKLYAFGLGVKGQLGINSLKKHLSPMLLSSMWGCQSKPILDTNKTNFKENYYFENDYESMINECYLTAGRDDIDKKKYFIREIFGGSLQSFALLKPSNVGVKEVLVFGCFNCFRTPSYRVFFPFVHLFLTHFGALVFSVSFEETSNFNKTLTFFCYALFFIAMFCTFVPSNIYCFFSYL